VLLAEQMVEGHLKPAAGVIAEQLPGVAQQLAAQPLKEQGGWRVVFCIGFVPHPLPRLLTSSGSACAVTLLAGNDLWKLLAEQMVAGHLKPAAGVLAACLASPSSWQSSHSRSKVGGGSRGVHLACPSTFPVAAWCQDCACCATSCTLM
jgi:hypothetical protein